MKKYLILSYLILSSLGFVMGQTTNSYGQTLITPNFPASAPAYYRPSANETWSDTAYEVTCDIIVENVIPGQTTSFSIVPNPNGTKGVNVYMAQGKKVKIIDGILNAIGTNLRQVRFTSINPLDANTYNNTWLGIIFNGTINSNHSQIKHSRIEFVKKEPLPPNACTGTEFHNGAIYLFNFNNITIDNCLIRNNNSEMLGGGIFIRAVIPFSGGPTSGYPIISNNEITNNTAKRGGGICVMGSQSYAYITNNSIYDNIANHSGGGISILKYSNADILNNNIYNNTAKCDNNNSTPSIRGGGGAVVGLYSTATIQGNVFDGNIANYNATALDITGLGGALLVRLGSAIGLTSNRFTDNTSANGGALAIYGKNDQGTGKPSTIESVGNEFTNNQSSDDGGAIIIDHSNGLFENNIINSNIATFGGGIYISSSTYSSTTINNPIEFYNNEITFNIADIGGAIWAEGEYNSSNPFATKVDIINNLIHSNQSSIYSAGIYLSSNLQLNLHNNTIAKNINSNNISYGDALYIPSGVINNQFSFQNNIFYYNGVDPKHCQRFHNNVLTGEFEYNDIMNLGCQIPISTNLDMPPDFEDMSNNNYRLIIGSSLIDRGNNSVNPVSILDLDFMPRFNGDIDIGAYESTGSGARRHQIDSIKISKVIIYPNPATHYLYINTSDNNRIEEVNIYSIEGKLLYHKNSFEKNVKLDISVLENGVLIIEVISNDFVERHKIIKQ